MDPFAVSHFSNDALLHNLKMLVAHDCRTTAVLLTRIAEVEERKLFLPAGYASMHDYCIHELNFSGDVAYKRVHAARVARKHAAVLVAVADGRLHLRAVLMLERHLTTGNAAELVAAAAHKTRFELRLVLAERFPQPDVPESLQPLELPPWLPPSVAPPAAETPNVLDPDPIMFILPKHAAVSPPPSVELPAPAPVAAPAPRARMTPLSPGRFELRLTIDDETQDLLQRARAFMNNPAPVGEIAPVLKSALRLFVAHHERRKYAATSRPRPQAQGTASNPRHIPASVKRAVRERDGDRCAFVSDGGQRCSERARLQFDHIEPVARGGASTVENLRLVCRAHNQYAAEREFGAEFMEQKRTDARLAVYNS